MERRLNRNNTEEIKLETLLNIEEGAFRYVKKYLAKNLSGRKKTDFTGDLRSEGAYTCGDNTLTTLSITEDKIIFSMVGEIPLTGGTDVIRIYNQFAGEEVIAAYSEELKCGEKNNEEAKETLKHLLCNGALACEYTSLEERANEIARSIKGAFALLEEY